MDATLARRVDMIKDNPIAYFDSTDFLSCGHLPAKPANFLARHMALATCEISILAKSRLAIMKAQPVESASLLGE